jgi:spore maturation protein CgeB
LCTRIAHYLKETEQRERIATLGQDRTLRTHTYQTRMEELIKIVKAYV